MSKVSCVSSGKALKAPLPMDAAERNFSKIKGVIL